jgi:hypothetical protein
MNWTIKKVTTKGKAKALISMVDKRFMGLPDGDDVKLKIRLKRTGIKTKRRQKRYLRHGTLSDLRKTMVAGVLRNTLGLCGDPAKPGAHHPASHGF